MQNRRGSSVPETKILFIPSTRAGWCCSRWGQDKVDEYWRLRKSVGLFDVPEKPLEIRGNEVVAFLNRAFTRPVDKQRIGRGSYGLLCHKDGGLVCDGILFRLAEDRFWYVHADAEVFLWLSALAANYDVEVSDPGSWVLQVQGPKSLQVLEKACDSSPPAEFRYFDVFEGRMGGQDVLVSRTGWSAELGSKSTTSMQTWMARPCGIT